MNMINVTEPLSHVPIAGKLYPVGTVTAETFRLRASDTQLLATSGNKPITSDIAAAYGRITIALIGGSPHAELTLAYVESWLSRALCTMVAFEWVRQRVAIVDKQGVAGRA